MNMGLTIALIAAALVLGGAVISLIVMLAVTAVDIYAKVGTFLYEELLIDSFNLPLGFEKTLGYVDDTLVLGFHVCLLFAVRSIAKELEDGKIVYSSMRNFVLVMVYYVIYAVAMLPIPALDEAKKYFSLLVMLFYFAWIILNIVLSLSCYARICDESDVDMPFKKSRFEFINKLHEKDEKAAKENSEFARQKLEEFREKRRTKKKK